MRKFKRGTSTFVADSGFRGLTDPRKLPCKFTVTTLHISLKTKIVECKASMTSLAGKKQAGNQKFLSTPIIQNALPRCFYFFPSNPSNSTFWLRTLYQIHISSTILLSDNSLGSEFRFSLIQWPVLWTVNLGNLRENEVLLFSWLRSQKPQITSEWRNTFIQVRSLSYFKTKIVCWQFCHHTEPLHTEASSQISQ